MKKTPIISTELLSLDEQIVMGKIYANKGLSLIRADEGGHEKVLEGLKIKRLVRLNTDTSIPVYEFCNYCYTTAKLIVAYAEGVEKWPDPFLKGFPTNPDKEGFHVLKVTGEDRVYKWNPVTRTYHFLDGGVFKHIKKEPPEYVSYVAYANLVF